MRERLRVLVCPQELKGSLTAFEAAAAIAAGVRRALPGATVVELPLADGGPGTAAIVSAQGGGELIEAEVTGPLGALGGTVRAQFALLPPATEGGGPVAVIEAAQAARLALVPEGERDVGRATTYGVGELVRAALDRGARELIVKDVLGQDLRGDIGVDPTGYRFGDVILGVTDEGRWADYVFRNLATGGDAVKHAWVVRHDGLIFGSGWYENTD